MAKLVTVRFHGKVKAHNKAVGLEAHYYANDGDEMEVTQEAADYLVSKNPSGLVEIVKDEPASAPKAAAKGRAKGGGGDA